MTTWLYNTWQRAKEYAATVWSWVLYLWNGYGDIADRRVKWWAKYPRLSLAFDVAVLIFVAWIF